MVKPIQNEALILGRYLVHSNISIELQERYEQALKFSPIFEDKSTHFFEKALKNKWLIPYFDAGFALTNPNCMFRKKIFLMLALLEATPDYCSHFIQKKATIFDYLTFILVGIRSVFRAVFGLLLLKIFN